jgi:hypothetical protein
MTAFDRLPPKLRAALADAPVSFSSVWCLRQIRQGRMSAESLVKCIPLWVSQAGKETGNDRGCL